MFRTARLIINFNQCLEAFGVGILALDSPIKAQICMAAADQEKKEKKTAKRLRSRMDPAYRHLGPSGYAPAEEFLQSAAQMAAYAILGPTRMQEKMPRDPNDFAQDYVSECKQIVEECVSNLDVDFFDSKAFRLIVGSRGTLNREFFAIFEETMKRHGRTSL